MQDVEPARLLEDSRHESCAVLGVEQVDDQRDHGLAVLLAEPLQRRFVAVDHDDARAGGQHRFGTCQPNTRRCPGHDRDLAVQFSRHIFPPSCARRASRNRALGSRQSSALGPRLLVLKQSPVPCRHRRTRSRRSRCPGSSARPTFACGCARGPSARRERRSRPRTARARSSACARSCASRASPSITGMIGVSPGRTLKPAFSIPARKRRACACRSSRRSSAAIGDFKRLQRPGGDRRRERIGEEIGPRPLPEQIDDRLRRGDEAAHAAAERLAEGAGDDVDAIARAGQRRRAAPLFAEMPGGVAVVDQHHRAVAVGERADLLQLGDIAVHREHAVGTR